MEETRIHKAYAATSGWDKLICEPCAPRVKHATIAADAHDGRVFLEGRSEMDIVFGMKTCTLILRKARQLADAQPTVGGDSTRRYSPLDCILPPVSITDTYTETHEIRHYWQRHAGRSKRQNVAAVAFSGDKGSRQRAQPVYRWLPRKARHARVQVGMEIGNGELPDSSLGKVRLLAESAGANSMAHWHRRCGSGWRQRSWSWGMCNLFLKQMGMRSCAVVALASCSPCQTMACDRNRHADACRTPDRGVCVCTVDDVGNKLVADNSVL